MAIIFPDIEKTLVAYFTAALTGVRVGTKHSQPDETKPAKELVITVFYGSETPNKVTKNASVLLEAFADTYANANALGLQVESLARGVVGTQIKMAEVLRGPSRTNEEGQQECRSLDVALIVKATDT